MFSIAFSSKAHQQLNQLEKSPHYQKQEKAVKKVLGYLAFNPRHPGLKTHEFTSLSRKLGYKVFEAYAENNTPNAYRVFWRYGSKNKEITILAISGHP